MNVQVIGATGMLGQAVCRAVRERGYTLIDSPLNLATLWPDDLCGQVVINCGGLVKQRRVNDSRFFLINAYGPQRLAEACDIAGARLIHVSTDCVFAGPGPHAEDDLPDARDVYARSKCAGEITRAPHLTVRTSFVGFGARGLLHELQTKPDVVASHNLLWSGHWVDTVARVLAQLIELEVSGLLHLPGTYQSRYELVCALKERFDLPARVQRVDKFVADRRLAAPRWFEEMHLSPLPSFADQLAHVESEALA